MRLKKSLKANDPCLTLPTLDDAIASITGDAQESAVGLSEADDDSGESDDSGEETNDDGSGSEEGEESGNESEGEGECVHMSERYSEGNVIVDESDESNDDWEADESDE